MYSFRPGSTLQIVLLSLGLLSVVHGFYSLNPRDDVCPSGGTCLDVDGNTCCGSGCMFSSGVCCNANYWCYSGSFCSTTDPNALSDGDVSCCSDAACKNIVGGAEDIIAFEDQPFYSGTGAAATSQGAMPTQTSQVAGTSTVAASTAGSKTAQPSASGTQVASPTASKSTAGLAMGNGLMGGLYVPFLVLVLVNLGWML